MCAFQHLTASTREVLLARVLDLRHPYIALLVAESEVEPAAVQLESCLTPLPRRVIEPHRHPGRSPVGRHPPHTRRPFPGVPPHEVDRAPVFRPDREIGR